MTDVVFVGGGHNGLAAAAVLARRGIKADFVITVRQYPFMAHAQACWRELPLTEPPPASTMPEAYTTLMRK